MSTLAPFAARFSDEEVTVGGYTLPPKVGAGGRQRGSGWVSHLYQWCVLHLQTPIVHALGVVLEDATIWPEPDK